MLRLVFFWILENRGFGPDEVSITQFELCFVLETVFSRGERSKKTATLTTPSTHLAQFQLVAVVTEAREIVQTGRPRRRSTKEVAAILASWEACQEVFREIKPWALSFAIGFVLGRCSIKHKNGERYLVPHSTQQCKSNSRTSELRTRRSNVEQTHR